MFSMTMEWKVEHPVHGRIHKRWKFSSTIRVAHSGKDPQMLRRVSNPFYYCSVKNRTHVTSQLPYRAHLLSIFLFIITSASQTVFREFRCCVSCQNDKMIPFWSSSYRNVLALSLSNCWKIATGKQRGMKRGECRRHSWVNEEIQKSRRKGESDSKFMKRKKGYT